MSLDGFHLARELPDFRNSTVFRYRNYGLVGAVRYPLCAHAPRSTPRSACSASRSTDLSQLTEPPRTRRFVVPRLTATDDRTVYGRFGPRRGTRTAAGLAVAVGPDAFFATVLADARRYVPVRMVPGATVALRASGGLSAGPNPQRFYAAGVQTWLNPSLGSLPVEGPDDFVFATPVLPLRGFGFNEAAGDRFALVNAEARLPLLAALVPGTLPLPALTRLQAVAFVDAGIIAAGGITVFRTPVDSLGVEGPRIFDDVLIGAGGGSADGPARLPAAPRLGGALRRPPLRPRPPLRLRRPRLLGGPAGTPQSMTLSRSSEASIATTSGRRFVSA